MNKMKVNLDRKIGNSYEIHIGEKILDRMGLILAKNNWAERYILVTDTQIDALHGERVQEALKKTDLRVDRITVPPGETAKAMGTVLSIVEKLIALGADRSTALIALGGGVIGDLTGFAASIFMRGIPVIQIPTTLLAQVDSSIGGKTGWTPTPARTSSGRSTSRKGSSSTSDLSADAPGRAVPQRSCRGDQIRGHRVPCAPGHHRGRRRGGRASGIRLSREGDHGRLPDQKGACRARRTGSGTPADSEFRPYRRPRRRSGIRLLPFPR